MTRFILGFNGIITKQVESDKRYEELKALQRELVCHRYVIIICWEYNHFTGIIVDKGDTANTLAHNMTYLDSLKGNGDRNLAILQRFMTSVWTSPFHPLEDHRWTINAGATASMIKQRKFRRSYESPWDAVHIDCGIYVLLMVQLIFLEIPLSVLTPPSVHAYRATLAWQLLHREQRVPLAELITPVELHSRASAESTLEVQLKSQVIAVEQDPAQPRDIHHTEPVQSSALQIPGKRQSHELPESLQLEPPPLPPRQRFDFPTNDPASLYTYASTSTLPDAGWGLFMGKPVGPSSPEDDGHIIGEYYGRELSKEEIAIYICMYAEESDVKT
jgi:hypothetical protein